MDYPKLEYVIENNFIYHKPIFFQFLQPYEEDIVVYSTIREEAKLFAKTLLKYCPKSRELSNALTNLEETVMWANAARARYDNGETKIKA